MQSLPIDAFIPEILQRLKLPGSLVLTAQPGAGKTTRVAPAIIKAALLPPDNNKVLMLQPRRVAARAVAQRIADENNWRLGETVGYIVRLERRCTARTLLTVMTEGVLNRQLLADPFLPGVGAVILDEFHERSIHSDLAIALLRQVQQTVRPDLRIIVMSATLDVEPVAAFLGGCPVVNAPGRTFPVEVIHRSPGDSAIDALVAGEVRNAHAHTGSAPGGTLVFLPGVGEIERCRGALADWAAREHIPVLPLHGSLPLPAQMQALKPGTHARIILATNIAETSLTIDGITTVIDSGLVRRAGFDAARGINSLELVRISKASAAQRAGRAGRTAPGRCVRLWSTQEDRFLADFDPPEITRLDLSPTVLNLFAWDAKGPQGFAWLTEPPAHALTAAINLLTMLGALAPSRPISSSASPTPDAAQNKPVVTLTPLGKVIQSLALHPRLACMLCAANQSALARPAALLAAMLAEHESSAPASTRPTGHEDSDVLTRFEHIEKFLNPHRRGHCDPRDEAFARRVAGLADRLLMQLAAHVSVQGARTPSRDQMLRLLLYAYPDRVCRRRLSDHKRAIMTGGRGVVLGPQSGVLRPEFFIAVDVMFDPNQPRGEGLVRMASAIDPLWLTQTPTFSQTDTASWDLSQRRVIAVRQSRYGDLILHENSCGVSDEQAAAIMQDQFQGKLRQLAMTKQEAAELITRLDFAAAELPQLQLPSPTEDFLQNVIEHYWPGLRSEQDLESLDWRTLIFHSLTPLQQRRLAEALPPAFPLPSGKSAKIEYSAAAPPVLAAKLQELFGLGETPRIAGGRVALLLHILGPNGKPVQVTSDIKSFWQSGYFMVRKDLKARYPRHYWPDDPTTAAPIVSARRAREQQRSPGK